MGEKIRRILKEDLEQIQKLYNGNRTIQELKWLFADSNDPSRMNAYVAIRNDTEVIGVIGYIRYSFEINDITLMGVIGNTWVVASDYKGMAAILLLNKVCEKGDFAFAISGSEKARSLYPMMRYELKSDTYFYYKILNLRKIWSSFGNGNKVKKLYKILYLLPSYFKRTPISKLETNFVFEKYDGSNYCPEVFDENVFSKKVNKNFIDWLMSCPLVKSYGFIIKKNELELGICVLYIKKESSEGKIVHIPFLGNDKDDWLAVIAYCNEIFTTEKCSVVSGLVMHDMAQKGFIAAGFQKNNRQNPPFYIKDKNNLLSDFNFKNWHTQLSDGDISYRW